MKMLWSVVMVSLCSIASMCCGSGCNIQKDTIRLVGGLSDQGLVEICVGNQWRSVCDFLWTDMMAEIVCQELNLTYFGAQATSGGGCSVFNMSTSDEGIFIQCTGEERSITECDRAAQTDCNAAGVICSPPCDPGFCNNSDTQCSSPTSTCYCPTPLDTNCICYEAICNPPCSNGGNCTGPDTCQCRDTWEGNHCQQAVCNPPCSNEGNCTGPDTCQCPETWEGDYCQQATCEVGFCLNGGTCLYPDTNCTCPVGWTGSRCNQNSAGTPPQSETTLSTSENNDQEMTGIAASSATVVCLVLLALAVIIAAFLVDRRRRRRRRVRFFKQSIRHAENTEEPSQIPVAELTQTPAAELQQIPPAGLPQTQTAEQNLPAASVRSSSIPIPTYSMVSRPHRPSLTSSQTNIESLYDEVVPSNIRACGVERACRVERLGTMERELGREDTETVESVLYRSTEELKAEPAIDEFNIYNSPT